MKINKNSYFLPNVVDFEHFATAFKCETPEEFKDIPRPRLIYHGVLSDFKLDLELLEKLIMARSDLNWIFIGTEREGQNSDVLSKLAKLSNTYFLGYRSYSRLPEYLGHTDLGLLPNAINEYTDGMFPMKFFEFIASGNRVVSTPLNFTAGHMKGLEVGSNADQFSRAIDIQLKNGRLNEAQARKFVGRNSWRQRTHQMLSLLEEVSKNN